MTLRPAMIAAAFLAALPLPALAENPVATIVTVKTPPGLDRARIDAGFREAVPTYRKIPGLIRKYFTVNGESFGGMYLWKDRAAADAWFTEAWRKRARATYGSDPELVYFDAPVVLDNGAAR